MSNAPYLLSRARTGLKYGNTELVDSLLCDGLGGPYLSARHMAVTAQTLADDYRDLARRAGSVALRSQERFESARAAGRFEAEIVPFGSVTEDQHPRPERFVRRPSTALALTLVLIKKQVAERIERRGSHAGCCRSNDCRAEPLAGPGGPRTMGGGRLRAGSNGARPGSCDSEAGRARSVAGQL